MPATASSCCSISAAACAAAGDTAGAARLKAAMRGPGGVPAARAGPAAENPGKPAAQPEAARRRLSSSATAAAALQVIIGSGAEMQMRRLGSGEPGLEPQVGSVGMEAAAPTPPQRRLSGAERDRRRAQPSLSAVRPARSPVVRWIIAVGQQAWLNDVCRMLQPPR